MSTGNYRDRYVGRRLQHLTLRQLLMTGTSVAPSTSLSRPYAGWMTSRTVESSSTARTSAAASAVELSSLGCSEVNMQWQFEYNRGMSATVNIQTRLERRFSRGALSAAFSLSTLDRVLEQSTISSVFFISWRC